MESSVGGIPGCAWRISAAGCQRLRDGLELHPPQLTEQEAREVAGEDAVYYGTKLSGASNDKAKKTFNFKPRRLQWLNQ